MSDNAVIENGTQSQLVDSAFNGGEIVPVMGNNDPQTIDITARDAALAIGGTMLVGYGVGKLSEFLWKKLIVPGYVKAVEKIDDWKSEKDERITRKKNKKKDEVVDINGFKDDPDENQDESNEDDPDENQDLDNKKKKTIERMRKNRNRR